MTLPGRRCGSWQTHAWVPNWAPAAARWPSSAMRGMSPRAGCWTRCVGFHRDDARPALPDRTRYSRQARRDRMLATRRRRLRAFARRRPAAPRVLIVRQTDLYEMPVRRQAEALTGAGYEVEVLCMPRAGRPRRIAVNGVRVTSLPIGISKSFAKSSKAGYVIGYGAFFVSATLAVTARALRRRYRVVQVNTMPDFLVFSSAFAKLTGSKVVAYMNEPTPELAETIYGS